MQPEPGVEEEEGRQAASFEQGGPDQHDRPCLLGADGLDVDPHPGGDPFGVHFFEEDHFEDLAAAVGQVLDLLVDLLEDLGAEDLGLANCIKSGLVPF